MKCIAKTTRDVVKAADNALIKAIAMDIGKEVAHHIEVMYPDAVLHKTFLLSVRNCTSNEIMAAIKVNDEGLIVARLADRKKSRRKRKAAYKAIRDFIPLDAG